MPTSPADHWLTQLPKERLAHVVRDAGRAYAKALQSQLAAHGVPFGHWLFLRVLWQHEGLTQRELSQQAGVTEPTTFAAMQAMQKQGLIERRQESGNKKNSHVYLTEAGRALEQVLIPLAEQVNRVSVKGITTAEVETTRQVLLAIVENLARDT